MGKTTCAGVRRMRGLSVVFTILRRHHFQNALLTRDTQAKEQNEPNALTSHNSLVADEKASPHFCSVRFSASQRAAVGLLRWIAERSNPQQNLDNLTIAIVLSDQRSRAVNSTSSMLSSSTAGAISAMSSLCFLCK